MASRVRTAIVVTPTRKPPHKFAKRVRTTFENHGGFARVEFCHKKKAGDFADKIHTEIRKALLAKRAALTDDDDESEEDGEKVTNRRACDIVSGISFKAEDEAIEDTEDYAEAVDSVRFFVFHKTSNAVGVCNVLKYVLDRKMESIDNSLSVRDEFGRDTEGFSEVDIFARSVRSMQCSTIVTDTAWLCGFDVARSETVFSVYNVGGLTQSMSALNEDEYIDAREIYVGWWDDPDAPIVWRTERFRTPSRATCCCHRWLWILFWSMAQLLVFVAVYNWLSTGDMFRSWKVLACVATFTVVQVSLRVVQMVTIFGWRDMWWRIPVSYVILVGIVTSVVKSLQSKPKRY